MGFEPTTLSLARRCSTTEPLPRLRPPALVPLHQFDGSLSYILSRWERFGKTGAEEETRTPTSLRSPPPQDGVSTNSTTSASGRGGRIRTHDQRFWRPPLYQTELHPCSFGIIPYPLVEVHSLQVPADPPLAPENGGTGYATSQEYRHRSPRSIDEHPQRQGHEAENGESAYQRSQYDNRQADRSKWREYAAGNERDVDQAEQAGTSDYRTGKHLSSDGSSTMPESIH